MIEDEIFLDSDKSIPAAQFPISISLLSLIIGLVFSSLLSLVYLTLRSYQALTKYNIDLVEFHDEVPSESKEDSKIQFSSTIVSLEREDRSRTSLTCSHPENEPTNQFGTQTTVCPELRHLVEGARNIEFQRNDLSSTSARSKSLYSAHHHNQALGSFQYHQASDSDAMRAMSNFSDSEWIVSVMSELDDDAIRDCPVNLELSTFSCCETG